MLPLVSTSARNGQTDVDSAVVMQNGLVPVWKMCAPNVSEPGVAHAHSAVTPDQDVVRLEVTMNEPGGMCGFEPAPRLDEDG